LHLKISIFLENFSILLVTQHQYTILPRYNPEQH
jgi:hypothetical protein